MKCEECEKSDGLCRGCRNNDLLIESEVRLAKVTAERDFNSDSCKKNSAGWEKAESRLAECEARNANQTIALRTINVALRNPDPTDIMKRLESLISVESRLDEVEAEKDRFDEALMEISRIVEKANGCCDGDEHPTDTIRGVGSLVESMNERLARASEIINLIRPVVKRRVFEIHPSYEYSDDGEDSFIDNTKPERNNSQGTTVWQDEVHELAIAVDALSLRLEDKT